MSQPDQAKGPPTKEPPAAARRAAPPNQPVGEPLVSEGESNENNNRFFFFNLVPSWMVSFLVHLGIIIFTAFYILPSPKEVKVGLIAGEPSTEIGDSGDSLDLDVDLNLSMDNVNPLESNEITDSVPTFDDVAPPISDINATSIMELNSDFGGIFGGDVAVDGNLGVLSNLDSGSETSSRSSAARGDMLKRYGGNAASEESVALALKWIIAHQLEDGGWSFDHQRGPGTHRNSSQPGEFADARTGATAMALLPLLGAGQTHKTGEYRQQIENGLRFLMKTAQKRGRGISFWDEQGTMYSHGLCAIVFNEAYAMTKDPELAPFAQGTIEFIEDFQDPVGGGWRYEPRKPGDTSVVGWQLMAMKSGYSTGMKISPKTLKLTERFLDSVSTSGGAFYGYQDKPFGKPANGQTAIGLLCRMYMGWSKDAPGLVEGVNAIAKQGPRIDDGLDMYYNYYATQLMKQYGGKSWQDWNTAMRDHLIKTQVKQGPGLGSWDPGKTYSDSKGGRLYATSMSCMTLEVYYRFLPLYSEDATSDDFKLD